MTRKVLAAAAAVAALGGFAGMPADAAVTHTDTYSYIAPGGDAIAFNCDGAIKVTEVGVGGLCFDILRGDTFVTVTINDESGRPVAGQLRFRDPANVKIGTDRLICGTSGKLAIPANADEILVWTFTAKSATVPGGCSPAIKGTMSATYEDA